MSHTHFSTGKHVTVIAIVALLVIAAIIFLSIFASMGFIAMELSAALIGFLGAIIGGALTLFGVRWTIQHSEEKRQEDLGLQYRPLLLAHVVDEDARPDALSFEVNTLFESPLFNDANPDYRKSRIHLENVGRGEIVSVKVSVAKCEQIPIPASEVHVALDPKAYVLFGDKARLIPVGDGIDIIIGLPVPAGNNAVTILNGFWLRLRNMVDFCIKGPFGAEAQSYKLEFFVNERYGAENPLSEIDTITIWATIPEGSNQ